MKKKQIIDEIIVVNDASTDKSLKKIKSFKSKKLKVISLKKNFGKSDAIKIATKNLKTNILFFCDGDLINLKEVQVNQIIEPLKDGKIAMSVGLRDYGLVGNFLYNLVFLPSL